MKTNREILLESLCLFDRPDRERLRGFLPSQTDVDTLVQQWFARWEERSLR